MAKNSFLILLPNNDELKFYVCMHDDCRRKNGQSTEGFRLHRRIITTDVMWSDGKAQIFGMLYCLSCGQKMLDEQATQ